MNIEEKKELVAKMIGQHRKLQEDINLALSLSEEPCSEDKIEKVHTGITKFISDLKEHLALENGTFYPELLKEMKEKGVDTGSTEEFIDEMKEIEVAALAFLGKYETAEVIKGNVQKFHDDLEEISSVLNIRIESEESGIYIYWE